MAKEYILTDIERRIGSRNNGYIYDCSFLDLDDLQVYMCIVDAQFRNWERSGWCRLVQDPTYHGVYTGMKRTQRHNQDGLRVISADSHPQLIMPLTEAQIIDIIEFRQQQLAQTQFAKLFEPA